MDPLLDRAALEIIFKHSGDRLAARGQEFGLLQRCLNEQVSFYVAEGPDAGGARVLDQEKLPDRSRLIVEDLFRDDTGG
jgi:hypothetical protein